MSDLVIVTGASSNHFGCLKNLLFSVSRFEPKTRVIVYDLGLTAEEHDELEKGGYEVPKFRFGDYPPHVDIRVEAGQYAWKPIIIADLLRQLGGMILWLDAGNLIGQPLAQVRALLAECGIYSMTSNSTIERWTHPLTLRYLEASPELLPKSCRSAGMVGFRSGAPGIDELVERWKACALDSACIGPVGSNRDNHRQDQAVLTVLLYQFQAKYGFRLENRRLDRITMHHDYQTREEIMALLTQAAPSDVKPHTVSSAAASNFSGTK
jgi:hypothetical protein